jgi:hypothetical protein
VTGSSSSRFGPANRRGAPPTSRPFRYHGNEVDVRQINIYALMGCMLMAARLYVKQVTTVTGLVLGLHAVPRLPALGAVVW